MKTLVDVRWEDGRIPGNWIEEFRGVHFENGGLRTGEAAFFRIPVPGQRWETVRVEIDLDPVDDGALIELGDGMVTMMADFKHHRQKIAVYHRGTLAEGFHRHIPGRQTHRLEFTFSADVLSLAVDGAEAVRAAAPFRSPSGGLFELGFWADCLVRRIRILGAEPSGGITDPAADGPGNSGTDLHLEVAVDFIDDLLYAPWTEKMFDRLFAEFQSWGVRKCHWIDYGRFQEGWWENAPGAAGRNARKTFENVGEIFPAAVRAAHAHGMEIHAVFKPFDMGLYHTLGEGTPLAGHMGKLPRLGGPVYWIADFAAKRRDLIMARKPGASGAASAGAYTRIDLIKEDDAPAAFSVGDLKLHISDDNVTYRPYEGPEIRRETIEDTPLLEHTASGGRPSGTLRRARIFRLENLNLHAKYFALSIDGRTESFANTLLNLVRVFGTNGEERLLTYGLKARQTQFQPAEGATTQSPRPDFLRNGVEFDTHPGTPSAVYPGFDAIRSRHALDSGEGFLALARGKEQGTVAALSPSFPEVRAWWISWLRASLEAGADGIELRVRNHHSPLAWAEFGFEKPVRDAFLRLHGIDIWQTDDFDKTHWRRLRGEGYTAFCREAKKLVVSYGKKLGLHISPTLTMAPADGAAMEVHWDWKTWLDEGLADSITMKEIAPGTRPARDILERIRARKIPVIYSPYANHLWTRPGGEQICRDWLGLVRQYGYNGFQLYECASVIRGTEAGGIVMNQPTLKALFREQFTASKQG